MKRIFFVVTLAVLLIGLVLLDLSDTPTAIADTSIPSNQLTNSQSEANNSSAGAGITITMYTGDGE